MVLEVRDLATEERSAAPHPEENEGFGGGSATDAEEDGAFVSLPPELRCTALWEEGMALSLRDRRQEARSIGVGICAVLM